MPDKVTRYAAQKRKHQTEGYLKALSELRWQLLRTKYAVARKPSGSHSPDLLWNTGQRAQKDLMLATIENMIAEKRKQN